MLPIAEYDLHPLPSMFKGLTGNKHFYGSGNNRDMVGLDQGSNRIRVWLVGPAGPEFRIRTELDGARIVML